MILTQDVGGVHGSQLMEERLLGSKDLLLDLLEESFSRFAWHGPSVMAALRGVDIAQASWRPGAESAGSWNIHEIARHIASVMQRCGAELRGQDAAGVRQVDRESFPLPDPKNDEDWKAATQFLRDSYEGLRRALLETAATRLSEISPSTAYGREWTLLNQVYGVALHNTYHAAQIVSIRKRLGTWIEQS